jgi:four helix bundle protein
MAKAVIQSYRDLEVWQSAMDLTVLIYEQAARLPGDERFVLSSQIRRAGLSIPSTSLKGIAVAKRADISIT